MTRAILAALLLLTASQASAPLPERLETYLATAVRPTRSERAQLLRGGPITKFLDADSSQEVAIFGAVWIDAPMKRYADAVMDIETLERGGAFVRTRRIGTPPAADDFTGLQLPADDISQLRQCRPGDCDVKVTSELLDALRANVDWRTAAGRQNAQDVFRAFAHAYVRAYQDRGNSALATYRDKAQPTSVAADLLALGHLVRPFTSGSTSVRRYLLEYPASRLAGSRELFYWQETRFGLKPTIRINHVVVHETADETVVASKMLYASHYARATLELRVLVPDPSRGRGFWFVTVSGGRVDGLSGLFGHLLRGKVRGEIQDGAISGLRATKRRLEQGE